eukprot:PhF_6_TR8751/c0_g1_i1/m.13792/K03953/NDUFA9; NADH dehydrogenase (ubiquinone) 1 alpha subcomplex subunit 9
MARRSFSRSLNGDVGNSWRNTAHEASMVNVTAACFGATGFVGKFLAGTMAVHRFTNIYPFRWRAGVGGGIRPVRHIWDGTFGQNYPIDYELDKEFVVKHILEKVDNVFNCVGSWNEPTVYEHSNSWFSMEAVNVEWPRMLARWSREMGIERFVHVSMVGADVNSPSKVLRQKALGEIAVLEEFPRATIIRSTDMFAEDDNHYTKYLKAQWYLKVFPVPNQGLRIHQPVFAGDIAEACCRAIRIDYTQGKIAELGGPVRFTTNDLVRWASICNGLNFYTVHLPKPVWKFITKWNERFPWRRGMLIGPRVPSWNKDWVERQFIDNVACPERDPNLLDWEDFGIAKEDLYRLEDKYFLTSMVWTRVHPFYEHGLNL